MIRMSPPAKRTGLSHAAPKRLWATTGGGGSSSGTTAVGITGGGGTSATGKTGLQSCGRTLAAAWLVIMAMAAAAKSAFLIRTAPRLERILKYQLTEKCQMSL